MKIHIVQKGDTLWEIAKKYGVDFEELKGLNAQLSSPDMIMPGMKIKIPGVEKTVKKEVPKEVKKEMQTKKEMQIKPKQPKEMKKEEMLQPLMPTPPLPKMPEISVPKVPEKPKQEIPVPKMPEIPMHQQLPIIEQQMNQYVTLPEVTIEQKEEKPKQKQVTKEKPMKQEEKPIQLPSFEQMQPMQHHMHHPIACIPMCCCMIHPCHAHACHHTPMKPMESHVQPMMQMPYDGYPMYPKEGMNNHCFPHKMNDCDFPNEGQYGNPYPFDPFSHHPSLYPPIHRPVNQEPPMVAPSPPSSSYEQDTNISKKQED